MARGIGEQGVGEILFKLVTAPIWFPIWIVLKVLEYTIARPLEAIFGLIAKAFKMLPLGVRVGAGTGLAIVFAAAVILSPPRKTEAMVEANSSADLRGSVGATTIETGTIAQEPSSDWTVAVSPEPQTSAEAVAPQLPSKKTYTPVQLRKMVAAGRFPDQGEVKTTSREADFGSCVATIQSIKGSIGGEYPASTIVQSAILRMEKIWTNDAAMTLSCSSLDRKMVITQAAYR